MRRFREDSGNAGMIARELPCDEVLASWQHVDQRAHDLRAAGMPGSLRELRIRAYLDLLQERDSRLAPVGSDRDGSATTDPDGNGGPQDEDDDADPGGNGGPTGPHDADGGRGPDGNGSPGSRPAGRPGSPGPGWTRARAWPR